MHNGQGESEREGQRERKKEGWREVGRVRRGALCCSSLCTLLTKAWNAHCVYLIYRHLTPMRRRDRTSIKVPLPALSLFFLSPLSHSLEVDAKCVCIMLNTCPCRRRQRSNTVAAPWKRQNSTKSQVHKRTQVPGTDPGPGPDPVPVAVPDPDPVRTQVGARIICMRANKFVF